MTKDKNKTKDTETDEYWEKVMKDNEFEDYVESKEDKKIVKLP